MTKRDYRRMGLVARVSVILSFLVLATAATPLPPEADASAAWFRALTQEVRFTIQADLVLTGDYDGLVDGRYGPATYAAVKSYQSSHRQQQSGILTDAAASALNAEAESIFQSLGMTLVTDPQSGVATYVPTKVLTRQDSARTGAVYSTPDGEMTLSLKSYPGSNESPSQFVKELSSLNVPGRTVTYSAAGADSLIVTGTFVDHRFYTFYFKGKAGLMGFTLNWTEKYAAVGALTAVFAASYADQATAEPQVTTAEPILATPNPPSPSAPSQVTLPSETYTVAGSQIGSFLVPNDDDRTIILNGDIGNNSALDFLRALRERPNATRILLNSDGGYVTPALLIAHEINSRGLSTVIEDGRGCYSACAYVFFAGKQRNDQGALGVHQIYGDGQTAETAQYSLSDILDALKDYDVPQEVISTMLRTAPETVHVFTQAEVDRFGINRLPAPSVSLAAGSEALLLEAQDNGTTGAVPFLGSVEWSKGSDEKGQPTLIGVASIPARNLQVEVLIRKNSDPQLPASHLMEINFTVSDSFIGGSIAGVPGVLLKDQEMTQGLPLVGASARVVANSFLFALSEAPEDTTANTQLLIRRKWIDIALIYASGKRAIFTLEKNDVAQSLFADAFEVWSKSPPATDGRSDQLDEAHMLDEASRLAARMAAKQAGESASHADDVGM